MAKNCDIDVLKALGDSIEDKEFVKGMISQLRGIKKNLTEQGRLAEFAKEAGSYLNELKLLSEVDKKNVYMARVKTQERMIISGGFKDRKGKALQAHLTGVGVSNRGAAASIENRMTAKKKQYYDLLETGMGPENMKLFVEKKLNEREIAQGIFSLETEGSTGLKMNSPEDRAAKAIHNFNRQNLKDKKIAGFSTGDVMGYVSRNVHDQDKVRAVPKEVWVKEIYNKINWEKTYKGSLLNSAEDARLKRLGETYDQISSGKYTGYMEDAISDVTDVTFSKYKSLQRSNEGERSLHFSDGNAWYDYHSKFGNDSLFETVNSTVQSASRDVSLMEKYGYMPEKAFQGDIERLRREVTNDVASLPKEAQEKKLAEFEKDVIVAQREFDSIYGKQSLPVDKTIAQLGQGARNFQSLRLLGQVALTAIGDVPSIRQAFNAQFDNAGVFKFYKTFVSDMASMMGVDPAKKEFLNELESKLGIFADARMHMMSSRFSGEDLTLPGKLDKAQRSFFKFTGMPYFDRVTKAASAIQYGRNLFENKGKKFSQLPDSFKNGLIRHNIGDFEWEVIKLASEKVGSSEILSPSAVRYMSDDVILKAAKEAGIKKYQGQKLSPIRAREEIATRFSSMMNEFVNRAVPSAGKADAALLYRGTRAGTWEGEALRTGMQYKAFGAAFLRSFATNQAINQGISKAGVRDLATKTTAKNVATYMAESMALYYLVDNLKDILANKDPEPLEVSGEKFARLFANSGFGAMYGDLILGGATRGAGVYERASNFLVGPTGSDILKAGAIAGNMMDAAEDGRSQGKNLEKAMGHVWSNVPGNNLWFVKGAADTLILDSLKKWANPGFKEPERIIGGK